MINTIRGLPIHSHIILIVFVVMLIIILSLVYEILKLKKELKLSGFPKGIRGYWACCHWRDFNKELVGDLPRSMPENKAFIPMPSILGKPIGTRMIGYKHRGRYGVYKLIRIKRTPNLDLASWDNGLEYDLVLVDVVDLHEAETYK